MQAVRFYHAGKYRCTTCGEQYPLMAYAEYTGIINPFVGGVHAPRLLTHGPGCKEQVWEKVRD